MRWEPLEGLEQWKGDPTFFSAICSAGNTLKVGKGRSSRKLEGDFNSQVRDGRFWILGRF